MGLRAMVSRTRWDALSAEPGRHPVSWRAFVGPVQAATAPAADALAARRRRTAAARALAAWRARVKAARGDSDKGGKGLMAGAVRVRVGNIHCFERAAGNCL